MANDDIHINTISFNIHRYYIWQALLEVTQRALYMCPLCAGTPWLAEMFMNRWLLFAGPIIILVVVVHMYGGLS